MSACNGKNSSPEPIDPISNQKLNVVATTSIVFDIVKQVGGDAINLDMLLPLGVDPHSFEATPQDIAKLTNAEILFINGAGLEEFIYPMIESSGGEFRIEDLSSDIELLNLEGNLESGTDHASGGFDPHIWMDPNNVISWVQHIADSLSEVDNTNSDFYQTNAQNYIDKLVELDRWIITQVKQIPLRERKIISDHLVFGYFVKRYDFKQVAAVLPSFSSQSQSSAQEIALLEDTIQREGVKAVFVSVSVNPDLTRRIAEDTGVSLIPVHTGTLTGPDGAAQNYIDLMRYDVEAIVSALR